VERLGIEDICIGGYWRAVFSILLKDRDLEWVLETLGDALNLFNFLVSHSLKSDMYDFGYQLHKLF
jgi:hypothetical protein